MVTTTVRMLAGIHGHTTNLRPRVPLSLVFEVSSAGLQQRLVDSSSTAMNVSLRFLNLYGSLNSTMAKGAPLPGSWMMSFTTPLMWRLCDVCCGT